MKVAFISQPFEDVVPPVQGNSLAIWTYQVSHCLAAHCDFIVYAKQTASQPKFQWHDNIQYRRISVSLENQWLKGLKAVERMSGYALPKRPLFSLPIYYLAYILQIARDLRQQQCDIVHIMNFSQFAPIIRAFNPDVKIVLHMHCEWLTQLDPTMIAQRLKHVDSIIGCTDFIINKIRNRFPQMADRCHTVFNGVDPQKFAAAQNQNGSKKRLLYVGRVSPEKGIHIFLEAFSKVAQQFPETELQIIGPPGQAPFEFIILLNQEDPQVSSLTSFYQGHLKNSRQNYLEQLQQQIPATLKKQINFLGPISHSHLPQHYRQADVLIFPSVWDEPFGIPLVEAMACQIPVIATQSGGMPEIVQHQQTGLLVERGNASDLAQAIIQLLKDDDLRRRMGQAGYKRVEQHFLWKHIAETLLTEYRRILV